MKKKLRLKPFVVPVVYTLFVVALIVSVFLTSKTLSKEEEEDAVNYVSDIILENDIPVISTDITIARPYTSKDVKIGKNFYDYKDGEQDQQQSIIYHENTYMQNSGVDYIFDTVFEIQSILDGEVIEVKEEELLGKTISIRHDNDIISVYQSLSEVTVKKGDKVTQGKVIGKSGTSKINEELKNHLHFELVVKGQIVDPESYFDKKLNEL